MKIFLKKYWKKIAVILLSIIVLVFFVILDPEINNINNSLSKIAPIWFILAIGCMMIYYLGDTTMFFIASRVLKVPQPFHESLLTTMLGFFYSAITPFASGGQPFQILQMKRRGINVGSATSIMMIKFISWHLVISIMGIISAVILWKKQLFSSTAMIVLLTIGIIVHVGCLLLGVMLSYKPTVVKKCGNFFLNILDKTIFKKKPEKSVKAKESWYKFIEDYRSAMNFAKEHPFSMLIISFVNVIEILGYMTTTYCVYRGLGFNSTPWLEIVIVQIMLSISVAYIPLPGASVASEGGFYAVFTNYFASSRSVGMLIWRILTYYMDILLGLTAVLIDSFRKDKKRPE